jgi:hypothetical protein
VYVMVQGWCLPGLWSWCGVVWCGVVWCGVVRCRCDVVLMRLSLAACVGAHPHSADGRQPRPGHASLGPSVILSQASVEVRQGVARS